MSDRKTLAWRDATSYSQGEERIPHCWDMNTAGCRIVVYRTRADREQWCVSVYGVIRLEGVNLKAKTESDAQHEGLKLVSATAQGVVDGLPRFDHAG